MKKRLFSILLAIILVVSVIPMTAFAADETNEIVVDELQDLLDNINTEGAVLKLNEDITLTEKVTINNTVTIDGNGHNIYGQNDDSTVYFEILGGTFTIKNANISQFGGALPTQSRVGVFKVPDSASADTKVIASGITVSDYIRSAFDISSGSFEITNSEINCENTYSATEESGLLTKGILAGIGSNKVTGKVESTKIYNSESRYDEWTTSGIEIYNNADVTVNNCEIVNLHEGISTDNYYYDTYGDINVTVENTNITVGNKAVRIYSKEDTVGIANVNILSGTFTGDIGIINKSDKDTIKISGGTFIGEVEENVTLAENTILEEQTNGSYIARIDNTELKEMINDYTSLTQDGFSSESWKNFESVLSSAKDVLNNVNATKTDIDNAVKNLSEAYNNLEKIAQVSVSNDTDIAIDVDEKASDVLNNNDKVLEYINDGTDVKTVIDIKDITPSDDEKKAVEEAIEDGVIAKYFDISVLIKNSQNDAILDEITELSESIKFTITLDEELKNVPEGYERTYKIIRIHDGKVEVLDATLSDDKNSLEFSTDKFSTYAISYVDTKIEDDTTIKDDTKVDSDIVQTGDYIYIAVGVVVLIVAINVISLKRKGKRSK